jgi:2-keto-3-deoxy-L-rhamnonate aldolase RhmA
MGLERSPAAVRRCRLQEQQRMQHDFRARLLRGERLIGTMVTLASPEVGEALAGAGFDWLFLDAEHGALATRDLQALMQGAGAAMPCVVRVEAAAEVPIKKALDIGAAGVIVPQVNSAAQAREVVRFAKYSPLGARGVGVARAHGYGLRLAEYLAGANEQVAVIAQVEHIDAVGQIEEIARVAGIDAVLIGPYDLSASLGRMGEVGHPEVLAAIDRVTDTCRAAGVPLGIFGVSAAAIQPYLARGYTLLVAGIDTLMLAQAAQRILGDLKA